MWRISGFRKHTTLSDRQGKGEPWGRSLIFRDAALGKAVKFRLNTGGIWICESL